MTTYKNHLVEEALRCAARGWALIPLHTVNDGICSCGKHDCPHPGKHPVGKLAPHGVKDAAIEERIIRQWWMQRPDANVGIATGARSGLVVLDVDPRSGGDDSLADLEREHGDLPHTVESLTGGRGRHIFFAHPGGSIRNPRLAPGLDLKGDGGYIVAPPSVHASGNPYVWELASHPDDVALAPLPAWLQQLAAKASTKATAGPASERIRDHTRNSTLTSLAGTMRRRGMSESAILAALLEDNKQRCKPPLPEAEVRKIAAGIMRYPPAPTATAEVSSQDEPFHLTDLGNARRLVARHGRDLHFCAQRGGWLVWDGRRWATDRTGEVYRRGRETVAAIYGEAEAAQDGETRKALGSHALKSEAEPRLRAMVSLAASEPGIPVLPEQLDTDPWVLNCLNGVLDLRSGNLGEHRRELLCTKLAPVAYDPRATCPMWGTFLECIMGGNLELIGFLQRAVGYSLTGDTSDDIVFILYGRGGNGKSTCLEVLRATLGDYAQQTPFDTFLRRKHKSGGPNNDVARLHGARLVTAVEADEGAHLAEAMVKQLTGGDTVTARFLHQEYFEFKPQFKPFLAANHKPRIRGTDNAIWRRIKLIPFTVSIPEDEQDEDLPEKLCAELPGILSWAVRGCLEWREVGLGVPAAVRGATNDYRAEEDVVAGFVVDCCTLEPTARVFARDLYPAYTQWCEANGEKPLSQREVGKRLKDRGLDHKRGTGGAWAWFGIGLKSQHEAVT
jgi:putative DNA primase/helicase